MVFRMIPSAFVLTFLALGAFVYLAISYGQSLPTAEQVTRLDTEAAFVDERSFFDRLVQSYLTPLQSPGYRRGAPIYFLPPAPEGWVRVTEADVQAPEPMADLAAKWPQTGLKLEQHPGFAQVQTFIRYYADPDVETQMLSRSRTKAYYLGADGGFLEVRLRYRGARSALGAANDPAAWTATLMAEAEAALKPGEIIEQARLAGVPVVNRTRPTGLGRSAAPIAGDSPALAALKLTAALGARVELRLSGRAAPGTVAALIGTIDRPAVAAQMAEAG